LAIEISGKENLKEIDQAYRLNLNDSLTVLVRVITPEDGLVMSKHVIEEST
jgi:hypothetical protein